MKILLVSAAEAVGSMLPLPLGLASVAAATEIAGHDVRLRVLPPGADWQLQIQQAVKSFQPDVVGVSARNIDNQEILSPKFLLADIKTVVSACRAATTAPIAVGGAGYSIFPESALAYLGADIGIQGEGEAAFPGLLVWLQQGANGVPPPGVCLPNSRATPRAFVKDLDELPLPAPELWLHSFDHTSVRVPVQTRRGCNVNCAYCSTPLIEGIQVRSRSPRAVVRWLEQIQTRGFTEFYFVDNTFNIPRSYAKELCREILRSGIDIDWWAIVYPHSVDAELTELMADAGCSRVSLGFESGSEPVLRRLNKTFACADVREIAALFGAAGIERHGFLLLGGPGETKNTVEESLCFAESLHLDALKITVGLRIYPHTPLSSIAAAEGMIRPDDDLLLPRFYLAPRLSEWLPARVAGLETQLVQHAPRA